jgi:hypothetical protein
VPAATMHAGLIDGENDTPPQTSDFADRRHLHGRRNGFERNSPGPELHKMRLFPAVFR